MVRKMTAVNKYTSATKLLQICYKNGTNCYKNFVPVLYHFCTFSSWQNAKGFCSKCTILYLFPTTPSHQCHGVSKSKFCIKSRFWWLSGKSLWCYIMSLHYGVLRVTGSNPPSDNVFIFSCF